MKPTRLPKLNAIGYFIVIVLLLGLFWEAYKLLGAPGGAYLRGTVPVQADAGKPVGVLCGSVGLCELKLPVRAETTGPCLTCGTFCRRFSSRRGGAVTRSCCQFCCRRRSLPSRKPRPDSLSAESSASPLASPSLTRAAGAGPVALCCGVADRSPAGHCPDGCDLAGRQLVLRGGDRRLSDLFPVTINTLQGLRSPEPTAVELMHSYAASSWDILWKLRVPRCPALHFLRLSKSRPRPAVVGAIIGELPAASPTAWAG